MASQSWSQSPKVTEAIANEAQSLLSTLRSSTNPGPVWDTWKCSTGLALQRIEAHHRCDHAHELRKARDLVSRADAALARDNSERSRRELESAQAVLAFQRSQIGEIAQDRGVDQHMTEMETSSRRFFRPPKQGMRVPINTARQADGSTTSDPETVAAVFAGTGVECLVTRRASRPVTTRSIRLRRYFYLAA